jgi:hypothetical protein
MLERDAPPPPSPGGPALMLTADTTLTRPSQGRGDAGE